MAQVQEYAVYTLKPSEGILMGQVVNRILWDGVAPWTPPDGMAAVADPDHKYPIGSIYTA